MSIGLYSDPEIIRGFVQVNGENALEIGQQYTKLPAGTTAQRPISPTAGMMRFNTDTGRYEKYSGTAWQDIFDELAVQSQVMFADGSASAPSITTSDDTNTGVYFPEADVVALTTGGEQRLKADANGVTAVITPQSSVPWTFSVRTAADLLSISNNVVNPHEVVFASDLTAVASDTTYTIEASGQLVPLWHEISGIQYNSFINGWESTKRSSYDIVDEYSTQNIHNKIIDSSTIFNSNISSLLALCHSNVLEGHAVIPENTNAVSILPISIPDGTSVTVGAGSTWNFLSF